MRLLARIARRIGRTDRRATLAAAAAARGRPGDDAAAVRMAVGLPSSSMLGAVRERFVADDPPNRGG